MPQNSAIKRGDVVVVNYPNSDLRTGKFRPALVVQADDLGTKLDQIVLVLISSRMHRANHPSRVVILLSTPVGQQFGLSLDSVIVTDNIATVRPLTINRVLGSIPMDEVDTALRHTLGL